MLEFFSDIAFAMSGKPTECRRNQLKNQISGADAERAKGVMSSLSRGSVLLQLEEIGEVGSTQK
jgi:hypothetical protein